MGKERDVSLGRLRHMVEEEAGAGGDLFQRFTTCDGGVPDGPTGEFLANVQGGAAFEDTVVPFDKAGFDLGLFDAGNSASFPGACERAGPSGEGFATERLTKQLGLRAAMIG